MEQSRFTDKEYRMASYQAPPGMVVASRTSVRASGILGSVADAGGAVVNAMIGKTLSSSMPYCCCFAVPRTSPGGNWIMSRSTPKTINNQDTVHFLVTGETPYYRLN